MQMADHNVEEPKVEETQQEAEAPLYGDILEAIFSHVPLLHLVPASHVSKSWSRAVSSSLRRHSNRNIKPWFILHTQSTRSPHVTAARAYDPASRVWIDIHPQPSMLKPFSTLRSSHSTLLYMLSPSRFAFSADPLHHTWHHVDAPLVWRTDPIVALVGHSLVVAGGTCDYEDDPLAVEMYDVGTRAWDTCESMPAILKDSAASTWLSVAVDESKMYVTEKSSGVTYSFDPVSKTWFGPFDLSAEGMVFSSVIGFANGRLILVGVVGDAENVEGVKMWEVKGQSLECKEEIGEMPEVMVEKLKGESHCATTFGVSCIGDLVCFHNPWDPSEVILCELADGGCRWDSVQNAAVNDGTRMLRVVGTCSKVGIADLHRAVQVGALKIVV